ncbi:MAG TPA: NAD(P)H-dependent oxidoreductase [Demequinaceae bacterium]
MTDTSDLTIAVILGSTRPGRRGAAVADWVVERAADRGATYELVDLADHPLPFFDEVNPPSKHQYQHPHTIEWAETIARFDGFIFVSPEYNHSTSAVLKNSLDYLNLEWNDKAAGIVTYGMAGGHRAAEALRTVLSELQVATVQRQVGLSLLTDFENFSELRPSELQVASLDSLFPQLEAWAAALKTVRAGASLTE